MAVILDLTRAATIPSKIFSQKDKLLLQSKRISKSLWSWNVLVWAAFKRISFGERTVIHKRTEFERKIPGRTEGLLKVFLRPSPPLAAPLKEISFLDQNNPSLPNIVGFVNRIKFL
jgi:hypothetical protein